MYNGIVHGHLQEKHMNIYTFYATEIVGTLSFLKTLCLFQIRIVIIISCLK